MRHDLTKAPSRMMYLQGKGQDYCKDKCKVKESCRNKCRIKYRDKRRDKSSSNCDRSWNATRAK